MVIICTLFFCSSSEAKDFIANGPLITRTQNPIYLLSLGQIPQRAAVLEFNDSRVWTNIYYSNMFERGQNGNNEVYLDMELARYDFNYAYGVGKDMEVSLQVPFLHFNGGYFDKFIQDYHKLFGFPNGGRETVPNGQFRYRITQNGRIVYEVPQLPAGISDIIFGFKHNVLQEDINIPAVSWTFRFKIPSGMKSRGEGSGRFNYSIGAIVEKSIKRWHFYLNLDYIVAPGCTYFEDLTRGVMLAYTTSIEFSVSTPVSLILQLQGSTAYLKGLNTPVWDDVPLDLIFGAQGTHEDVFWGHDLFWKWGFTEDLYPDGPSVDVGMMFTLGINL